MTDLTRKVELMTTLTNISAAEAYRRLADFKGYPEYAEAVRKVDVLESGESSMVTAWEVRFRDGLLRWTEKDELFPERGEIRFEQLTGDVETFYGSWWVEDAGDEVVVRFSAVLDLGIPSLASLLNPIAEQALIENIRSIMNGLFRECCRFDSPLVPPDAMPDGHREIPERL